MSLLGDLRKSAESRSIEKMAYVPFLSPLIGTILSSLNPIPFGYEPMQFFDSRAKVAKEYLARITGMIDSEPYPYAKAALRHQLFRLQYGLPPSSKLAEPPLHLNISPDKTRVYLNSSEFGNFLKRMGKVYPFEYGHVKGFMKEVLGEHDAKPIHGKYRYSDVWDYKINPGEYSPRQTIKDIVSYRPKDTRTGSRFPLKRELKTALRKDAIMTTRHLMDKMINPLLVQGEIPHGRAANREDGWVQRIVRTKNLQNPPVLNRVGKKIHMASKPTQYILNTNNITGERLAHLRRVLADFIKKMRPIV